MSETFKVTDGRRVVAVDTAEELGEVKGFIVDPTARRIEAVHISGKGDKAEIIPWSRVRSFGADAVVADAQDAVQRVAGDRETEAVKGKISMLDSRILNTSGFEKGRVKDVMFDADSGELTGVLTDDGRIDAARLRSLGSYALIVDPLDVDDE